MGVGAGSVPGLIAGAASLLAAAGEGHCEPYTDSLLGQQANTLTSLAFVVAGIAIAVGDRRDPQGDRRDDHRIRRSFGALVATVGIGSVVQHGPNPLPWADLVHDLPLAAVIVYLGVDAAADLSWRRLSSAWWVVPTAGLVPLLLASPRAGDAALALLSILVVVLWVQRARTRPGWRTTILVSLVMLGAGGAVGALSRGGGPLCDPGRLFQGHAVWHVLAAGALWWLAPAVGTSDLSVYGRRHVRP